MVLIKAWFPSSKIWNIFFMHYTFKNKGCLLALKNISMNIFYNFLCEWLSHGCDIVPKLGYCFCCGATSKVKHEHVSWEGSFLCTRFPLSPHTLKCIQTLHVHGHLTGPDVFRSATPSYHPLCPGMSLPIYQKPFWLWNVLLCGYFIARGASMVAVSSCLTSFKALQCKLPRQPHQRVPIGHILGQ